MPSMLILKNGLQIPVKEDSLQARKWRARRFVSFISQSSGHPVSIRESEIVLVEQISQDEWDEQVAAQKARAEAQQAQSSRLQKVQMVSPGFRRH